MDSSIFEAKTMIRFIVFVLAVTAGFSLTFRACTDALVLTEVTIENHESPRTNYSPIGATFDKEARAKLQYINTGEVGYKDSRSVAENIFSASQKVQYYFYLEFELENEKGVVITGRQKVQVSEQTYNNYDIGEYYQ